jgi:uncharacterized protein (TIGR03067 family)
MFVAKVKFIAAVILGLSVFLAGAGVLAWQLSAQTPVAQQPAGNKDKDALQGEWKVVSGKNVGKPDPNVEAEIKGKPFVFKGDKLTAKGECDYTIDPAKTPKELDVVPTEGPENEKGKTFRAIYELKGDDLKITFNNLPDQARPKTFDEDGTFAVVLRRVKGKE